MFEESTENVKNLITKGINGHKINASHKTLLEFLHLVNGAFVSQSIKSKNTVLCYQSQGNDKLIQVATLPNRTIGGVARLSLLTKVRSNGIISHYELSIFGKQVCKMLFS